MIEAYPLHWPIGYKRSVLTYSSRFGNHSLSQATKEVLLEIERLGATNPIISTNIPLRLDGMPRSDYSRRIIDDKGVAVYFMHKNKQVVLACDRWNSIEDNLWAIACSISAMRSLDRWGVSDILERAFTGFTAIPERSGGRTCWDVLGMAPTKNEAAISEKYREMAKVKHPDVGGSHEEMNELNEARKDALEYCKQ